MKPKEDNPMLVDFRELPDDERWGACLNALKTDYTLDIKSACKYLMCSRSWFDKNIHPFIHNIYLSQRYAGLAGRALEEINMTSSVWLHAKEFEDLILSHITSVTRRTISVPIEALINPDPDKIEDFRTRYREIDEDTALLRSIKNEMKKELLEGCLSSTGKILYSDFPALYNKRTTAPAVPFNISHIDISKLMSVHDMKDYGDTDEEVHRKLFCSGACRMELHINDSSKVYYYFPEDPVFPHADDTVMMIPVRYDKFLEHLDLIC